MTRTAPTPRQQEVMSLLGVVRAPTQRYGTMGLLCRRKGGPTGWQYFEVLPRGSVLRGEAWLTSAEKEALEALRLEWAAREVPCA